MVQSVSNSIKRKLSKSAWCSLYQQARMQAASNASMVVSKKTKQLLPGKFMAPMFSLEIKRWMHLLQLGRVGPGEKTLTDAGLLKPLLSLKTRAERMRFAANMSWRVTTLAQLRQLPICSPEVRIAMLTA